MPIPPTRASAAIGSLLREFGADALTDGALPLLQVFDHAGWWVDSYLIEDTAEGQLTSLRFASSPLETTVALPGLPVMARVGLRKTGSRAVLRVLSDANGRWLEVGDLEAALEISPALLSTLDGSDGAIRIQATIAVRVNSGGQLEFRPEASLSLPWSRVTGLPIDVRLDNVQFALGSGLPAPDLSALGFDTEFVGLYAESAALRLLPELRFGESHGIELSAMSVVLGNQGFSARLAYAWYLKHDGRTIDSTSELTATLYGAFAVALSSIEVTICDGLPENFLVRGVMRLPYLGALFGVDFGLQPRPGGTRLYAQAESLAPASIDLGAPGSVDIAHLRLQGELEPDHLALFGQLDQLTLSLGAVSVSVASAELRIDRTPALSELTVSVGDVRLGPLGSVPDVDFVLREATGSEGGTHREAYLAAQMAWRDLRDRVQVPAGLPSPPDDATVGVKVAAHDDGSGAIETSLELSIAVSELDFGTWLPSALRPEVRKASLALSIAYTDNDFNTADTAAGIAVAASGAMQLRLPDLTLGLPGDLLHVATGDADGWVDAVFSAGISDGGEPFFDVAITEALAIEVQLPGLHQPEPPIFASIDSLSMDISGASAVEGAVVLRGRLELRPIVPPRTIPIAMHVEQLFAAAGPTQVAGDCELALRFRDDKLRVDLAATFDDAGVSVDLFGMIANLASGVGRQAGSESVPLSLEAGVSLNRVSVSLGSLDPAEAGLPFAVEVIAAASIAGLAADCVFAFSDDEIVIGIRGHEVAAGRWNTDIPLALPRFPVAIADVDLMRVNGWSADAYRAKRAQQIAAALGVPNLDGEAPLVVRARGELDAATFLLRQVEVLRAGLSQAARDTFTELWVRNFVAALEALTGWFDSGSDVRLRLEQFVLKLPVADPRNLGVEGTLSIVGFAANDPLAGFNGTKLSAGISADLIYFALDGTGEPIELPPIGRYTQGTVSLGQFRVGYGYTNNSFNVVLDGAVEPPPALVADLDTSAELGVGVRVPSRNAVYFRLGLIPIPGPIPAAPVFDLNLDLRTPNSLPLVDAHRAIPFWDGMQFIADGLFRVDLKHVAISPMLGPLPVANVKYDGDWLIGNDDLGFTVIADNVHVMAGVGTSPPTPIPYLIDPLAPYFDNLVLNLRIAGFKLNVNLQHPFPSFNPLALFELFALLSDPSAPIDPNGPLANSLRISVKNVRVEVPQWARQLFPESTALIEKPGEFTLNVGTALSAVQALLSIGKTTLDAVTEVGGSVQGAIDRLPELVVPDVDAVLSVLPPELRKIRLGGSLAGFEARTVILLISPDAASLALRERDEPPRTNVTSTPVWGDETPNSASVVPAPLGRRGQRESFPGDPAENLFRGMEFVSFTEADLDGVTFGDAAAVVIGAHVKVFEAQRYRFLGVLASDGSFLLVTTADVRPLRLRVAGIDVRLPFEASARMRLAGRTRRDGFHGSIKAQGFANWAPLPGVLSIAIGSARKPVELALYSDGAFQARGAMQMQLFSASLDGTVDVSNTHCFVAGRFNYTAGTVRIGDERKTLIALEIIAEGRVGPGVSFRIAGSGSLRILDQPFSNVTAVITDHSAQVSASIDTDRVTALTGFPLAIDAELSGSIDLRRGSKPSFSLTGRIDAQVFDFAIHGAGYIASHAGQGVRVRVEGSLYWGGHEWLGGFLEAGTMGLNAGGRTQFAFPLTHPGTSNARFAHLYCEVNVGGRFELNFDNVLASWRADASCLIGMRLPPPSNQFIPLASFNAKGHGSTAMKLDILNFKGFEVPGMPDVEITVPKIVDDGSIDVDLVSLGAAGVLEFGIPYMEGTPGPPPNEWLGFVSRKNLLKIPMLKLDGTETVNLGKLISNKTTVYITFEKGHLVLKVESGDETVPIVLVDNPS